MKNNRIKKLTALAETKFLSLYDAEYENKKGNTKHWIIATRKNYETLKGQYFEGKEEKMDAVIIAALHAESKKIICIRQFRVPLNDYVYELPAGLIDGNESMEVSVERELKEETGLKLVTINYEKTKKGVYATAGMSDESAAIVFCTCEGNISKEYLEEDEDIEALMLSQQEARELLKSDVKIDMRAFIMLHAYAELGEKLF
ncbi:NUDIX hydrolase [Clostridium thermarum]|uniref:NUDIX hydrolase n=1 Tax=Clostridium thermarum TaxID=1716543 RepID=UPI0013D2B388|nr:NUDIX hydrolase [Clostridium thermarum]